MRTLWALLVVSCTAGSAQGAAPGVLAPAFTLEGRTAPVSLADYRGKFVYLDFWASWCAPCKRSFPWMGELQKRYSENLQVIAINVDASRTDAERFLARTPAGFTVAFDPLGAIAKLYAIKGMPTSVLIGPAGKVIEMHVGFSDATPQKIESQVKLALQGGVTCTARLAATNRLRGMCTAK